MLQRILLTTGCSYGKFGYSFRQWLIKDVKFQGVECVIDLHAPSTGAKYQMLSIVESVETLLNNGVHPDDIFVLAEFSEMIRKDVVIDNKLITNYLDNLIFEEEVDGVIIKQKSKLFPDVYRFNKNNYTNFIGSLFEKRKFFLNSVPKLNDYYVINFENISYNFKSKVIDDMIKFHSQKSIPNSFFVIDRAIDYFQNILFAEQYLKSKGIKYKFCLINNQFSMYDLETGTQTPLQTKVKNKEHFLYQNYIDSNQIWEVNSTIKMYYQMIDWSNWWFYENREKNIIWGGIDEYAIDVYGIKVYDARNTDKNLFGQHPDQSVYDDLIKNHIFKDQIFEIPKKQNKLI